MTVQMILSPQQGRPERLQTLSPKILIKIETLNILYDNKIPLKDEYYTASTALSCKQAQNFLFYGGVKVQRANLFILFQVFRIFSLPTAQIIGRYQWLADTLSKLYHVSPFCLVFSTLFSKCDDWSGLQCRALVEQHAA